ncbi:PDZ domain-containing protein [Halomonas campisalis]|uniref:PDZ domain-containing protein n=1 Tax=Billgrantia campisalis TaxID=74661 RepID=A0ABS9P4A4_9GAMM|nr:ChaN family lipoprotein [Halomonas campisalis]MCG6656605.1 PDZ domain-containing protein [Halomonas campisalis]MDR5861792.1 ChaN family lipoprotein [Halomonas campisalis]
MSLTATRAGCLALACLAGTLALSAAPAWADTCLAPGEWRQPGGERLSPAELFSDLAEQDVVLLGEQHDRMDHHRWQLSTLAGLHARRPDLVIGLEMLPREAQPALDAWVAGELDEQAFLDESNWRTAWGFDPALYFPILHFARLHRVPLQAVNITPELRGRLVNEGWEAVPEAERFAISAPAEPPEAYRERLAEVYEQHPSREGDEADFARFVAAQLAWDRAMAAGLAEAGEQGALVVGLIGQGHLAYGHGVPHQLSDLGVEAHSTLLPWQVGAHECEPPPAGLARAVFAIDDRQPEALPPMQLGVYIVPHEEGVEVHATLEGSIAEQAGLEAGDVILRAAGEALARPADLTGLVRQQRPGTLLPLQVRRHGEEREILARFPPRSS